MKVGILSPAYSLGGSSKVADYIGKKLHDEETEVFFISYLENSVPIESLRYYDISSKKSFLFTYLNKFKKFLSFKRKGYFSPERYVKNEINLLRIVLQKENPDVIILNTFLPGVLFSSFIKNEFSHIKLITWMHSDPEYSLNHIAKFYKKVYIESFKKVDQVICLSENVREILVKYGANSKVIYNPLVLTSNKVSTLTSKVISFTARLDIYIKGIDYLCELANCLPDGWIIRIAGDGDNEERSQLLRLVSKNKVENKIEFVGPLSGQRLVDHYVNSSIFISTSRTEGLPLVMIEALSFGLPVISFDHNGAKEILLNGKFGILVSNEDVKRMSEEINRMISDRSIMQNCQLLSLERAKDFKSDKIIQEWKSLLNNLVYGGEV